MVCKSLCGGSYGKFSRSPGKNVQVFIAYRSLQYRRELSGTVICLSHMALQNESALRNNGRVDARLSIDREPADDRTGCKVLGHTRN